MDEIEIIEFVVDQVGAIHSRPPSQSTRREGGDQMWKSPATPSFSQDAASLYGADPIDFAMLRPLPGSSPLTKRSLSSPCDQ